MNEKNKKIVVCPKCFGIPFLKIIIQHPEQIEIDCQCSYHEIIKVEEYLNILYKLNYTDLDEKYKKPKCKKHNRICDCFCITCTKHLCKLCRKTSEHWSHLIRRIVKHFYIERIIRNINEAYDFLNNYIPLLINKSIERFPNYSQALKRQADYFKQINKNILHILQFLVNTYQLEQKNYIIIKNLHQNCNISCLPFYTEKKVTFDLIMVYLLESCILKEPYSMKFNLQNMVIKNKDTTTPYEVFAGTYKLKDYSFITIKYSEIIYQFLWNKSCIDIFGSYERIYSIAFIEGERFVLGSSGSLIFIYQIKGDTIILEHIYYNAHKQFITVVGLPENRIASCGSEDGLIKIWRSIEPYDELFCISTHNRTIDTLFVLSNQRYFISGSIDSELKMWDITSYQCECVFSPVNWREQKAIFELSQCRLIIGGEKMITIINYKNKQIEMQFKKDWIEIIYAIIELRDGTLLFNQSNKILIRYNDRKKVFSKITSRKYNISHYMLNIDNTTFLSGGNKYQVIQY